MSLENPSGTPIRNIPVKRQGVYTRERANLGQQFPNAEIAIRTELNAFVDQRIVECGWTPKAEFCSSWIPGPNWEEGSGVYQPIFNTMVTLYVDHRLAHQRAGFFFGLLLMDVMIHRDDPWVFRRESHQPDDDPEGLYYFPNVQIAQAL